MWLSALVVLLNNLGNLSLAWGMRSWSKALGLDPRDYVSAMLNPFVALGVCLLVLWLLTRMALLSWADLSFVVPVTSVGYVVGVALARLVLHEAVGPQQWLATILITGGAALAGSAAAKTEKHMESDTLAKTAS